MLNYCEAETKEGVKVFIMICINWKIINTLLAANTTGEI